jgi:Cu2+-exporting ATPase
VQLANRIGAWFVIVVLGLALLTLVVWWWIEPARAVSNVVALLIVACPCALALATPLAIAVSIGRLAKRQVLVRSGDCLERLSKPGTIFFDKTGTLTEGRMRVAAWFGPTCVLRDIARIESGINHPIAVAIVDYSKTVDDPDEDQLETGVATNVQYQIGRGVSGTVDGLVVCVCSRTMMLRLFRKWNKRLPTSLPLVSVQSLSSPTDPARPSLALSIHFAVMRPMSSMRFAAEAGRSNCFPGTISRW